jgi:hypothetical protein
LRKNILRQPGGYDEGAFHEVTLFVPNGVQNSAIRDSTNSGIKEYFEKEGARKGRSLAGG